MKGITKIGINLGAIVVVLILLVVLLMSVLRSYTRHDVEHIAIPEIEGMRVDRAIQILEKQGFEYEINDTIYMDDVPLMSVVDQDPDAGFEVKPGRRIYLVINADKVPMVTMPAIAGRESYRSAINVLKASGLRLGNKIEQPSSLVRDKNSEPVLEQRLHGDSTQIRPGTKVRRNSRIDLVVGKMITASNTPDEGEEVEETDAMERGE